MRFGLLLVCFASFAAAATDDDDRLLERAGLPADGPKLIEHFRRLTPSAADEQAIAAAIAQLTDTTYAVRQQAMRTVVGFGPKAIASLQKALTAGDAEAAHRARACLDEIDREKQPAALIAAIHRVVKDQAPGAAEALLDYAPFVEIAVADELRNGLIALARVPRSVPVFRDFLKAERPEARAAAAVALIYTRDAEQVAAARTLLADANFSTRTAVALALVSTGDRATMPTLLDMWDKFSLETMSEVDDLLVRLAGGTGPELDYGVTAEARAAYQKAWRDWWTKNGATADFGRLDAAPKTDTFWVSLNRAPNSMIAEASFDGKTLPRVTGLDYPMSFERLTNGRFLIAEFRQSKVIERDAAGNVFWEKSVNLPIAVQRLPGGNTFVANRSSISITNRSGQEVLNKAITSIAGATRRRDGAIVVVTSPGRCQILDAKGNLQTSFAIGRVTTASIQALPGGRVLVPEYLNNRVAEYDSTGRLTWSAEVTRPNSVFRRADGRTLVSSQIDGAVTELDRNGKAVRVYRTEGGMRPTRVTQ